MGQGLSCGTYDEHGLFSAVQFGDLETVAAVLAKDPGLIHHTVYDRYSVLHVAAANGQIEVLSMLLSRSVNPDLLNRHKQTPLMLAAMHGKISCVQKLIEAGANEFLRLILKFMAVVVEVKETIMAVARRRSLTAAIAEIFVAY